MASPAATGSSAIQVTGTIKPALSLGVNEISSPPTSTSSRSGSSASKNYHHHHHSHHNTENTRVLNGSVNARHNILDTKSLGGSGGHPSPAAVPVLSLGLDKPTSRSPPSPSAKPLRSALKSSSSSKSPSPSPLPSSPSQQTPQQLLQQAIDQHQKSYDLKEISNAVDIHDDESFQRTTFALKRTRSMGLLDEFIKPSTDLIGTHQDYPHLAVAESSASDSSTSSPPVGPTRLSDVSDVSDDMSTSSIFSDTSSTAEQSKQSVRSSDHDDLVSGEESDQNPIADPDDFAANDDSVLQYEPSRHVDYLSHDWKESDISSSWRYIVLRRKDVANSARLENASWRTWTKAKYNLKTVSPESVNWLKDCDVTWLYGPLYTQPNHSYFTDDTATTLQTTKDAKPVSKTVSKTVKLAKKPILKKRSVSEMILNLPSHHRENEDDEGFDLQEEVVESPAAVDEQALSDTPGVDYLRHHNYRHRPHTGQSDEKISRHINMQYRHMPGHLVEASLRAAVAAGSNSSNISGSSTPSGTATPKTSGRHIHFNDRVEQCIVVESIEASDDDNERGSHSRHQGSRDNNLRSYFNGYDDSSSEEEEDDYEEEERTSSSARRARTTYGDGYDYEAGDEDDDEDDEESGLFLNVRSCQSASLHKPDTKDVDSTPHTIAPLPATTLKYAYDESEQELRRKAEASTVAHAMTHNTTNRRGPYQSYDYNSVYTAPQRSVGQVEGEKEKETNPIVRVAEAPVSQNAKTVSSKTTPSLPSAPFSTNKVSEPLKDLPHSPTHPSSPRSSSSSPQTTPTTVSGLLRSASSSSATSLLLENGNARRESTSAGDPDSSRQESGGSRHGKHLGNAVSTAKDIANVFWPGGWKRSSV